MNAAFVSRPGILEVHMHRGPAAAADAPPDLLLEVPHGATAAAHFDELHGRFAAPPDVRLREFFFVNTDVGSPELAHAVAAEFVAAHPTRTAAVVRCLIPRTFLDCNRRIDAATAPAASAPGAPTPGLPPWIVDERDRRMLLAMYEQYREVVEAGFAMACGGGGLGLMVHTYAPRSIDVAVDDDIVGALRAEYAPDKLSRWPLRSPVDFITHDPEGRDLSAAAVVAAAEREFVAAGYATVRNGAYNLHPVTLANLVAERHPGATVCLEVRRDLLMAEFVPFVELAVDPVRVAAAAAPLARAVGVRFSK
ncbi:MAG: hypothetical protein RL398_1343 [Planctomycetota bacterium]|jgi:hypothetical protein